ncbi:GumC family protein [Sphingomonas sp. HT-1]|uniref:GumC family protein n=1 Tax=unclassified Sphingomonas TaxID=196159 RepID=UPI00036C8C8C|nr:MULTISPECIES: polysaccharide biosynthesis tyrosine autokinase [unclassified Sphingomonas]KTF68823.1 hypothetical protein ATB93_12125 [Sphingomonas sp. WG]
MNSVTPLPPVRIESRFDQARHIGRKPITLSGVGDALRRRLPILVGAVLIAMVGAAVVSALLTPLYSSTTRLRIVPRSASPLDFDARADTPLDQSIIETEVASIGSRDTARAVVRELGLQYDSEFLSPAWQKRQRAGGTANEAALVEHATSKVLDRLSVARQGKSYVVQVGFSSEDPVKAAKVANALANAYISRSVETIVETASQQSASLGQRLSELGNEVREAESKVAQYRAQTGIVEGGGGTVSDQQVAPLAGQLATAEAQAASARSDLAVAERQSSGGSSDAVGAVLGSTVIADLRRQRSEAEKEWAVANSRYGAKHPQVIGANDRIQALDQQIRQEQARIIEGLRAASRAADARVTSLRSQLSALRGEISQNNRASVQADSLEREAAAKRAAYERLSQANQQNNQAKRIDDSQAQARIIERATVSASPSFPNKKAMLAAGLLVGLLVGFGGVLVAEGTQSRVRTPEDVELLLGLPFLASVPDLGRRRWGFGGARVSPATSLVEKPASAYAESFRTIRRALQAKEGVRPKVIAITSTLPAEGKTTTALSLARVMAMSGDRVLLIDCDVRRASLLSTIETPIANGLVELLEGRCSLSEALMPDVVDQLTLLPVARASFTPVDLFHGPEMDALLAAVRRDYDYVVLDTPPLLGVADARALVALADTALLLVKWNATSVAAIDTCLAGVEQDGTHVGGVVMTMVDRRAEAMGALYYSHRYGNYYQN